MAHLFVIGCEVENPIRTLDHIVPLLTQHADNLPKINPRVK